MTEEEAGPADDEACDDRLQSIATGIIGFIKGFSFGRHLDRRYD